MNNSENPNTVPTQQPLPTVPVNGNIPVAPVDANPVPQSAPLPTVPLEGAAPVENPQPVADPRMVGIENQEFIHTEAFSKVNEDAVVNEKLKNVEVNYTPPSKLKTFLVILLFILLISFVIFLPEVTTLVDQKLHGGGEETVKITNGRMICTLSSNTINLDKNHELIFSFTDNKLERITYILTTKGDPTEDAETINDMTKVCKMLSKSSETLKGVSVNCKQTDGKLEETQNYDLKDVDFSEVRSAFTEAGGLYPEYGYQQDMDVIERGMTASGYECKRGY